MRGAPERLMKLLISAKELGFEPLSILLALAAGRAPQTERMLSAELGLPREKLHEVISFLFPEVPGTMLLSENYRSPPKNLINARKIFMNNEIIKSQPFYIQSRLRRA